MVTKFILTQICWPGIGILYETQRLNISDNLAKTTMDAEFLQLCKDGDADKVSLILKEKRAHVNVTDSDGMSGLMHAGNNKL